MIRLDRLEELATHLESGKLGHDRFDLATIHSVDSCGTAGCAYGELPTVWPSEFELSDGLCGNVRSKSTGATSWTRNCHMWFGIDDFTTGFLFDPYAEQCPLTFFATREEAAAHIRSFIATQAEPTSCSSLGSDAVLPDKEERT